MLREESLKSSGGLFQREGPEVATGEASYPNGNQIHAGWRLVALVRPPSRTMRYMTYTHHKAQNNTIIILYSERHKKMYTVHTTHPSFTPGRGRPTK